MELAVIPHPLQGIYTVFSNFRKHSGHKVRLYSTKPLIILQLPVAQAI
jgi:hypothetical protein